MSESYLRVTERCLREDLRLDEEAANKCAGSDARQFADIHEAVAKFVQMRGAEPGAGEPIYGPRPRGIICSLHVGAARGVTTWVSDENVCWLLGYNAFHRIGDPNDAYAVFNRQHAAGDLMPTEADWERFFAGTDDDFYENFRRDAESLLARARANPGREEVSTWGGRNERHLRGRGDRCIRLGRRRLGGNHPSR